jgi:GNAT superfamily N-acetyltransferase
MEKNDRSSLLTPADSFEYTSLLFQAYQPYLRLCGRENIIAAGVKDQYGKPCGLALALAAYEREGEMSDTWNLLSIFVKEEARRTGCGRMLWGELKQALGGRDAKKIRFQTVLREEKIEEIARFTTAIGFSEPEKIAKIFSFTSEGIIKSPFVTGSLAEAFHPDERFDFLSFNELMDSQMAEIEANDGEWYPPFVNPLIGKESFNKSCTIFALDNEKDKIAGWITAIDVNDCKRVLYRAFFTREEYRDTPIGFFIFTQAIKNHLNQFPDRGGLSSIPIDNDKAMRFSELFFRGAFDHISFEITGTCDL